MFRDVFIVLMFTFCFVSSLVGQNFTRRSRMDEDFCTSSVLVVVDRNVGAINRVHNSCFFTGIDLEYVKDLTVITGDPSALRINKETFRQILLLRLRSNTKEEVLSVIERLRFIDGIEMATPNYIDRPSASLQRNKLQGASLQGTSHQGNNLPNDPYFTDGRLWGLENKQAPETWRFKRGSRIVMVGVIEGGIGSHIDLNANVIPGWNFVNNNSHTYA